MKAIINGKMYNTETAKEIGGYSWGNPRDFAHVSEALYVKKNGEYFIAGSGGPRSKYSVEIGQNSWSGSEAIRPLDEEEAKEWAEKHISVDEYIDAFGEPEE